jgi:hypothetical protein
MNKLITTPNGGFPLRSNDFRFIDESVRDAFKGILSMLYSGIVMNNQAVILSGCSRSLDGTFTTISPGYLSIGGEVCYFPGISGLLLLTTHYWDIDVDYYTDGDKILKSGSPHQSYQTRVAKVSFEIIDIPLGYSAVLSTQTATQKIQLKLEASCVWASLPDASYEDTVAAGAPKYLKDLSGFVHLKGVWNNSDPSPDNLIGRLPLGFRPAEDMQFSIWNGAVQRQIVIKTDGDINFVGAATGIIRLYELPPYKAG